MSTVVEPCIVVSFSKRLKLDRYKLWCLKKWMVEDCKPTTCCRIVPRPAPGSQPRLARVWKSGRTWQKSVDVFPVTPQSTKMDADNGRIGVASFLFSGLVFRFHVRNFWSVVSPLTIIVILSAEFVCHIEVLVEVARMNGMAVLHTLTAFKDRMSLKVSSERFLSHGFCLMAFVEPKWVLIPNNQPDTLDLIAPPSSLAIRIPCSPSPLSSLNSLGPNRQLPDLQNSLNGYVSTTLNAFSQHCWLFEGLQNLKKNLWHQLFVDKIPHFLSIET